MYCSKCGVQLPDDSRFCNSCGAQIANIATNAVATVQEAHLENPYDRDVTQLHLYDLRMLEMAKAKLCANKAQIENKIRSLCIPQNFRQPCKGSPEIQVSWIVWCFVAVGGLFALGWFIDALVTDVILSWVGNSKSSLFMGIATVLAIIVGIIGVIMIFVRISQSTSVSQKYQQELAWYQQQVQNDRMRIQNETAERNNWMPIKEAVCEELEKAKIVLNKAYSVNLVPEQYRNLYAVYYLYEYISTSQESFRDALLHWNLHYNFEEIKQKLDAIYYQVSQLVIEQAITNAHLENIQEQNEKMLESAIKTEKNTAKAAQYSQVAAANTEAMVYIGVAQYISQNF